MTVVYVAITRSAGPSAVRFRRMARPERTAYSCTAQFRNGGDANKFESKTIRQKSLAAKIGAGRARMMVAATVG